MDNGRGDRPFLLDTDMGTSITRRQRCWPWSASVRGDHRSPRPRNALEEAESPHGFFELPNLITLMNSRHGQARVAHQGSLAQILRCERTPILRLLVPPFAEEFESKPQRRKMIAFECSSAIVERQVVERTKSSLRIADTAEPEGTPEGTARRAHNAAQP
ncbi:MAG: hypothetical protein ACOC5B_03830, partial [Myxococcota bacterium]